MKKNFGLFKMQTNNGSSLMKEFQNSLRQLLATLAHGDKNSNADEMSDRNQTAWNTRGEKRNSRKRSEVKNIKKKEKNI